VKEGLVRVGDGRCCVSLGTSNCARQRSGRGDREDEGLASRGSGFQGGETCSFWEEDIVVLNLRLFRDRQIKCILCERKKKSVIVGQQTGHQVHTNIGPLVNNSIDRFGRLWQPSIEVIFCEAEFVLLPLRH